MGRGGLQLGLLKWLSWGVWGDVSMERSWRFSAELKIFLSRKKNLLIFQLIHFYFKEKSFKVDNRNP